MKSQNRLFLMAVIGLAIALAPLGARAQVPGQIPIQGYLTDTEGEPYDAEVAINFTIYDAATGGTELFSERQTIVVDRGVFSAYLGTVEALDLSMFRDSGELYLGVQVGSDAEASPRLAFGTVPWAAYSDAAATFGGVAASELPTVVDEWAREACLDTEEELTALLDDNYANPAWDNITGIPDDIADGDQGFTTEEELTALLDDNYANPAWDSITGIPAGFADGMDDGFTTEDELTVLLDDNYLPAGWVPSWGDIVDIPDELADGDDVVTAGAGLALDGDTLSVVFGDEGEEDVAARADTVEELREVIGVLEDRVEALEAAQPQGVPYRWALFSTYDQHGGRWALDNRSDMFGGVHPSQWTDGGYRAVHMSRNSDVLRRILHRRGYASPNSTLIARAFRSYSSTNGWVYLAMFRIRNTTDSSIVWRPRFYVTAYGGWGERAGVAVNGSEVWQSGGSWFRADYNVRVSITLPARRTSTVIFSSTTSPPSGDLRFLQLAFVDNSLELPEGLEAIDDLDTVDGDLW